MRILTVIFFCLSTSFIIYGQNYSFNIYFEDSAGNRDTLEFGLNPQASIGIDEQFNEVNIIGEPFESGLDVRIMDRWLQFIRGASTSYHTKKQVVPQQLDILNIIIKTDHFPVTALWDSQTLVPLDSIGGSIMTSINPGGWFDTGSPSDMRTVPLKQFDSITFTSNLDEDYNENYAYIFQDTDTVPTYWFTFAPVDFLVSSDILLNNTNTTFTIYPNPSSGDIFIEGQDMGSIKKILLFDHQGLLIESTEFNALDLGGYSPGMYFVQVITKNGKSSAIKVIRQ
ncbi:MAG: T9SS type A sorting domain-containing protein [Saprospiraceae bacterium]|nr:T9SS type A sorting domain-containing protein [Saprospiraceae bacterium]